MLPFAHKIAFCLFAIAMIAISGWKFLRLYRRIRSGTSDVDLRFNKLTKRLIYAVSTTLAQNRTFRKRPWVSFFHSLILYGFAFYLIVNLMDAVEGYTGFAISSATLTGAGYNLASDVASVLVLLGVAALVVRRFATPSKRDFDFNQRTLLHEDVRRGYICYDSLIVSGFILFHVGSRIIGAGAKLLLEGPDAHQPFASAISHLLPESHAKALRIFGYWGALGSVLAFLVYFSVSKHIHLFMAPLKYLVRRDPGSGVIPALDLQLDATAPKAGAAKLEDLAWPRLLDAYACIQCNRCQDVCPASATGKALSPAALEINKRMELNELARRHPGFENGETSPRNLLAFAISEEALWACTTCGACMEVCPVQNEQMLDIIDVRRHQVMIDGTFPTQLQAAFRGMERAKNPWGINVNQRLAWAEGLHVPTIEDNPKPEVLYWVGCAASYDPQAQKTARAFVQLLQHAGVDFAVLGKSECCTGDSARRAGNEYLYRQLADQNVSVLNRVNPKKIVATCPHCLNALGNEYPQLGGNYEVEHHTQYLESLVADGKLSSTKLNISVTYHDPCYLGRHNGVYDAPRNLLKILSDDRVELGRSREDSFCCGAGGAQFWKEEEPGTQRIAENRFREVEEALSPVKNDRVLAVGCPFCKSMLQTATHAKRDVPIAVRDVAELLLESVKNGVAIEPTRVEPNHVATTSVTCEPTSSLVETSVPTPGIENQKNAQPSVAPEKLPEFPTEVKSETRSGDGDLVQVTAPPTEANESRKKWKPKASSTPANHLKSEIDRKSEEK